MSIYLTAIIKVKPGYHSEVFAILQNMVKETRKEAACIQYDLLQGVGEENIFVFYEIWEDEEGLNDHNQQPYILEFGNLAKEKLEEAPQIYLTKKI